MPQPEEFGSPCLCGCEHFERVIVERVLGHPIVTDLMACVECRCVYYSPLPRPAPAPKAPANAWTLPASDEGLLSRYGVGPDIPRTEQSPEEKRRHAEAVKAANKGKQKGFR